MDLHLVGGFLGSGKTTAIIQSARLLVEKDRRVAIITNEQGKHLVDTGFLHAQGLPALEVTGGCICCHLDDFADRIEEITERFNPDVLFAESVGSCTDLVATVIKPLADYRDRSTEPASFSVFTDSRLLLRHLRGEEMPFSDNVIYIFEKQIEETELLILNKIDLLSKEDRREITRLAENRYPDKTIRPQNSHHQKDIEGWLSLIESRSVDLPNASLELDYDIYAEGEGRFCWLDRGLEISFNNLNSGKITAELIVNILNGLSELGGMIAHLKFLVETPTHSWKINMTSMDTEMDGKKLEEIRQLDDKLLGLTINAMIEGDQDLQTRRLDNIINSFCEERKISYNEIARFDRVPGYPRPTMRIGNQ